MSNIATAHEARERAIFRNISNNAALLAALATVASAVEKAAEAGLFSTTVDDPDLSESDGQSLNRTLAHLGYRLWPFDGFQRPSSPHVNCAGDCNPGGRCRCAPVHQRPAPRPVTISWSV